MTTRRSILQAGASAAAALTWGRWPARAADVPGGTRSEIKIAQKEQTAAKSKRRLSGDYFENCNCDVVCPCVFSSAAVLTSKRQAENVWGNVRGKIRVAALAGALGGANVLIDVLAEPASAATNFALTEGASFVNASSYNTYAITGCGAAGCAGTPENGGIFTMANNVITNTPTPWLSDGDIRYIFAHGDQNQWIEINLGTTRSLLSFGATFNGTDRPIIGPFYVQLSTNGTSWTQVGASVSSPSRSSELLNLGAPPQSAWPANSSYLINLTMPANAEYVKFFFGPTSPEYGYDGSAVSQVFALDQTVATGVPEPPTWAMILLGFAGLGYAGYRWTRSGQTALSAA